MVCKNYKCVRLLTEADISQVEKLDDMSGNYVSQWLEDNDDYAWGLFIDGELIGYCSIGYADDVGSVIMNYPGYSHDSLLLSDVFIKSEYRNHGYAVELISGVLEAREDCKKNHVFLTVLYDGLSKLYEKLGFDFLKDGVMVRDFVKNKKLYHATFNAFLPSIETGGLLPGQQKNWEDCQSGFVYLTEDMNMAIDFCETAEDTPEAIYESGICCFEVNLNNLVPDLLFDDPNISDELDEGSRCYAYAGVIPYEDLRMIYLEKSESIKISLAEQIKSAEAVKAEDRIDSKLKDFER